VKTSVCLLSILIASLKEREGKLAALVEHLRGQPQKEGEVEILTDVDAGQKAVGAKRNELLKRSKGRFVSFVDDDDWVSNTYIPEVLCAIKKNMDLDCIGFFGVLETVQSGPRRFIHSITVTGWSQNQRAYLRPPNHLNPIRASIAKQIRFPEQDCGEDHAWSTRLAQSKLLKNEVFLGEKPLYFYRFTVKGSRTQA
jgi:glycosyltransferase involved in cell wall biosynthesis